MSRKKTASASPLRLSDGDEIVYLACCVNYVQAAMASISVDDVDSLRWEVAALEMLVGQCGRMTADRVRRLQKRLFDRADRVFDERAQSVLFVTCSCQPKVGSDV